MHASWLAPAGHTAKIACKNVLDEKQAKTALAGIHITTPEKEKNMKNR